MNRLIQAGLLAASESRLKLTAEGRRAATRIDRLQSSARRVAWLGQRLGSATEEPVVVWQLSQQEWKRGAKASRQHRRSKLLARMEIVDGLLDALGRLDEIKVLVRRCRNQVDARDAIVALGYTPLQAQHILNATVSRQTEEDLQQLRTNKSQLQTALAALGELCPRAGMSVLDEHDSAGPGRAPER